MSRGKLEDMEQKETSEVDWIICFALIQSRNPTLWKRALSRKKGDVEDVGALKSEKNLKINSRENSKHIYKWVAPFENGFLNNKSLFAHLEPIYNFLCQNKYKSFEDAVGLKELQSFSKDVSTADINNWFLPRYKILLKILSLKTKEIDFKGLSQVFQTLQVLLVSHYSHRIDSDSSFKRTLIDVHVFNFIAKFLFNRILLKKNQNDPKWLQNFYDQGDGKHLCDKVDYKRLCSLHFTLIYSIINIQLIKIKTNQTFEPQILKYVSVLKLIEHILIIIESLIHVLIRFVSKHKLICINRKKAYCRVYLERELSLKKTYLKNFYSVISGVPEKELGGLLKILKIVILSLLETFESIEWQHLKPFLEKFPAHEISLQKKRKYIQAALLITAERNLIARFRLSRWFNETENI
ncbi:CIH_HP2_G0014430.mRNA.1.CDS.1 [Saccharomyces cerevisiae]|nr:Mei4p [Saccharomyces cerevisiae YJM1433]CAI5280579.1 CIH_HP2_G0014430.mRNA.1.CDS.1 [Saccharomyces cerevisiae]CAI6555577.1 CIH_HP2_G0014430.mRNA.1.CDS.1 [Saccharomyces cerevisiae]CAI6564940.1 CIH_HP1_G0014730.mRNA.1.CDS.1 [Saccharomyces cerevisiae]CAI7235686.1 CIH_collapsed_G0011980.mRNA.1.CDS.1 [Saccharomyces cerevisiae]